MTAPAKTSPVAGTDAAPAAGSPGPVSLDSLPIHGGRMYGSYARRAVIFLADGRRIDVQGLPEPTAAGQHDHNEPSSLTDMQQAVLQAIKEMTPGEVSSFDQIADRAGYSNSERLREFVRHVSELGTLIRRMTGNRGWERI